MVERENHLPKVVLWPTHRHTDTQTHRHTDTHTHRHTDTQRGWGRTLEKKNGQDQENARDLPQDQVWPERHYYIAGPHNTFIHGQVVKVSPMSLWLAELGQDLLSC